VAKRDPHEVRLYGIVERIPDDPRSRFKRGVAIVGRVMEAAGAWLDGWSWRRG
jgi:hypothetical protein